jgi:type III secretion system YscD/HrpQ family protein
MKLIAALGPNKGLVVNLEEKPEWIIGRDPDQCNFVIEDTTVSRKHCKIYKTAEGFVLKNLSTTNPTEVNDERIDEYLLQEKDKIKIGDTYFTFTALSEEEIEEIPEEIKEEETREPIEPFTQKVLEEKTIIEEKPIIEPSEEVLFPKEETSDETIFEESLDELPSSLILESAFILRVISGPNAGSEFGMEKSKSYIIGKDPASSDIIFTDLSVSKNNTKITIDENKNIFVEDLGSKNGTYVNNVKIEEKTQITSNDLITVGTTTFLIVGKEAAQETIYSPAPTFEEKKEGVKEEIKVEKEILKTSWKKQIIPIRHLLFAGSFIIIFFVSFLSFFALFRAKAVSVPKKEPTNEIKKIMERYSDVQFSYNPSSSNLLLVGHVLSGIDKQELLYDLKQLNYISNIEDTIIVDEGVWKDFNATLSSQEDFKSIALHANQAGKFIVEGYVKTPEAYQKLTDYINTNFPYLNQLENKVIIDQILQVEIATKLFKNNFPSVTFEIISGELVLAGRINKDKTKEYENILNEFKRTPGITSVKNLAIASTEDVARVDLTDKYRITGSAQYDGKSFSVVANGKIITLGDVLDGMRVTLISSNAILLEKDDIKYKINFSP